MKVIFYLKEHCEMNIQFCTNESMNASGSIWLKILWDQSLAYALICNGTIHLLYQLSDAGSCEPLVCIVISSDNLLNQMAKLIRKRRLIRLYKLSWPFPYGASKGSKRGEIFKNVVSFTINKNAAIISIAASMWILICRFHFVPMNVPVSIGFKSWGSNLTVVQIHPKVSC